MNTVTIEEVQARLPEILDDLSPRSELLITRNGRPVARLAPTSAPPGVPRAGRGKGKLIIHSDDDLPLETFAGPIG